MARNMITGKETQKMQEFTQEQIDRAEHMEIEIPADVKEQIFEYANLIGEEEKVRMLVRTLSDALSQKDNDKVEELLDDAKMDIQDLPDPTIGKLELRDYGYTAEDMVPLRKEAALDYHRMGSKIYCLGSDGGKGEYASKEMIQAHEGLFGMESQMWERIRNQDLDYADEDFGVFQEPMSVINQEEALKLYDAGADIYLITNFSSPIYVTERMEIERGPEHYQMSMAERERFRNLEWEMQKYPQIQSLKEANLLLGTRRTFGIYQIKDDSPGENYAFMNMSFIESHGMQIKKEDYKLVYVGDLSGNMSLGDIFERFNIDRPEDFRGHSLSVSDIVVLNDGEKVTAHFVDSISFEQLDSFLNLEEQVLSELAYEVGERYFAIQRTEGGYDYSFYDEDFRLMDGGVYENGEISIEEAAEELLEDEGWTGERIRGDYDRLRIRIGLRLLLHRRLSRIRRARRRIEALIPSHPTPTASRARWASSHSMYASSPTLQTAHEDDGRMTFELQWGFFAAHEFFQFIVHQLDHQLSRLYGSGQNGVNGHIVCADVNAADDNLFA